VQSGVGSGVEVSAVVKSDAYGLGLPAVVETLWDAGCRSFFVGDSSEAAVLAARLPAALIYVLSGTTGMEGSRGDRTIVVCNRAEEVIAHSTSARPYALNLETGFSRLGIAWDELADMVSNALARPPALVMSHLACADDVRHPFNRLQRDCFEQMASQLPTAPRSLVASAGIALGSSYYFEQVRVGSALYGLTNPALPIPIEPVVELRAPIIDVRVIEPGSGVGYMATFQAARRTRVAIVAMGYRHGLAWSSANRLHAEIGSYCVPLIGRVSMEYAAVDVTDLPPSASRSGVWVTFVSPTRPVEEFARSASTVPQEVLVRAGAACTRTYAGIAT
jgi:alanine racemase